jgi:hypothetical protein
MVDEGSFIALLTPRYAMITSLERLEERSKPNHRDHYFQTPGRKDLFFLILRMCKLSLELRIIYVALKTNFSPLQIVV